MPLPYARISILGTLVNGEVWSVNPAFTGNFTAGQMPSRAELQAWLNAIDSGVAFPSFQSLSKALSGSGAITGYRVSTYGENGRLLDYVEKQTSQPITGSSTLRLPPTAAVCLSLGTGVVGRSGRGRLFWPALGLTLNPATGRIPTADCLGMAQDAVAMLAALAAAGPDLYDPEPAVYSRVSGNPAVVDNVRVGDLVDSQRGRKDAFSDNYSIALMP